MDRKALRQFLAYLRQFWRNLNFWSWVHLLAHCALVSCEVCDEQFEKKSGLMNHMLLVHLIASPVNVAVKS